MKTTTMMNSKFEIQTFFSPVQRDLQEYSRSLVFDEETDSQVINLHCSPKLYKHLLTGLRLNVKLPIS